MAKFSLARLPYYIYAAFVCAVATLVLWVYTTMFKGIVSDLLLLLTGVCALLAAWSVYYAISVRNNVEDDIGIEVAGLPAGKEYYYGGIGGVSMLFFIFGYQMNHNSDGFFESSFGIMCFFLGIGLLVFTYANYQTFANKQQANKVAGGPVPPVAPTAGPSSWRHGVGPEGPIDPNHPPYTRG